VRPKRLPGISSRAWEHPADAAALATLRKVPGFDLALKTLFRLVGDRSLRLLFLGSAVRVTPHQFGGLFAQYRKAADILDVENLPELFVAQTPFVNAGAMGLGQPFIVIQSGAIDLLDEQEMRFLLGHELGHVASGHGLYKTMLRVLLRLSTLAFSIPAGGAALLALTAALLEWDRKSELSADRAGLLTVQDVDVANRFQMKVAGGGRTDEMSLVEFLEQAREYEEGGSVVDSVFKLLQLSGQTHPFPVLRLAETKKWSESDAYSEILAGGYPRRADDDHATVFEDLKRSAASYKETFETSRDPLVSFLRNMVEEVRKRTGRA
jgi:Zn-dependent protease with chaperone function